VNLRKRTQTVVAADQARYCIIFNSRGIASGNSSYNAAALITQFHYMMYYCKYLILFNIF